MNRKEYFNEAAETWDRRFVTTELTAFLENLVPTFNIKPGQKVLDVGTGTGVLIPFLIQAVGPSGRITAIDNSERMLEICRRKYSHFHNITIRLQDAEKLDLPSGSFDFVTCFGLFPHLEDKERALHEMSRVLRNGGKLVIAHSLSSEEIKAHHRTSSAVS
jgi:demethylmenaquinone methyltransferase/2-methoxy-6-polyprenyl-1,4-benzoquinol methylase